MSVQRKKLNVDPLELKFTITAKFFPCSDLETARTIKVRDTYNDNRHQP